jgi:hypothetical protein
MELRKSARSHQQLQQQVGGLSDAVGYGIEDRLMPFFPEVEQYVARKYPHIHLVKTYEVEMQTR